MTNYIQNLIIVVIGTIVLTCQCVTGLCQYDIYLDVGEKKVLGIKDFPNNELLVIRKLTMKNNSSLLFDANLAEVNFQALEVYVEGKAHISTTSLQTLAQASNGVSPPQPDYSKKGPDGTKGRDGAKGKRGVNLNLKLGFVEVDTLIIVSQGGKGQKGGNGGNGAKGGGSKCPKWSAGNGGNGGPGGRGGDGGDGGDILLSYTGSIPVREIKNEFKVKLDSSGSPIQIIRYRNLGPVRVPSYVDFVKERNYEDAGVYLISKAGAPGKGGLKGRKGLGAESRECKIGPLRAWGLGRGKDGIDGTDGPSGNFGKKGKVVFTKFGQ